MTAGFRPLTVTMEGRLVEQLTLIAAVWVFWLSCVKGEIRCYCNQATCVSTGYMCKSTSFCFSDLGSGVHGCLDRRRCTGLHCCKEDMCNYMHVDIHAHTHKAPMTGSFDDSLDNDSERMALLESALQREVWFKAAVIAVPIGGVCILAVLVVAAVRMLRQDVLRQKRLLELRRVYGYSLRDSLLPWNKEKDSTIV